MGTLAAAVRRGDGANGTAGRNGHGGNGTLGSRLLAAATGSRRGLLEGFVRQEVGRILALPEWPDARTGFFDLGMDSLGVTELATARGRELGQAVPATVIFEQGNASSLSERLLSELGLGTEAEEQIGDGGARVRSL